MINNKKAISLISLIITILVMVILATIMIPSGIDKLDNARLATFNDNILTLKEESSEYFMLNDDYPIKTDISGNPIIYSVADNSSLLAEVTKKKEQNDTFYILDLDKLKIDNKDIGIGKTIDDYYIIGKNSLDIYYIKGIKIGNIFYYTKQNKSDGVVAVIPTSALTPTPTLTPASTPTLTPASTPTLTLTPTSIPTSTPTPIPTITRAPSTITLSNVLVGGTSSGTVPVTQGTSTVVSGKVQGNNSGEIILINYKISTNSITTYSVQQIGKSANLAITCDTTLQSFSGNTMLLSTGDYTITIWAENQYGDKSSQIVRDISCGVGA